MNGSTWRRARRAALVVACVGFFSTMTVIGQVAEGDRYPVGPDVAEARP
ncbi:hypothetical protein [Aeromicrobium sp. 179-A 4D2 NHS]